MESTHHDLIEVTNFSAHVGLTGKILMSPHRLSFKILALLFSETAGSSSSTVCQLIMIL
jgi:hypothetical protein